MTKYGGETMGMPNERGQTHEGFLADLLLVDSHPADDPKVLLDHHKLLVVRTGTFTR